MATNIFSLMGEIALDGVDETKRDLEEVSRSGEKTKESFTKSFEEIGTKVGEVGKRLTARIAAISAAAIGAVEGTKEFRQDLGKLETTFETTGHGTELATNTFKDLYAILGEDDTSIEAANHLALMTKNEKELNEWTSILTGVYATFGDSLPLEGLAEAANETARVGQVTGPLADALNWLGVSEDEFNEKLTKSNSESERNALIRETLTGLYGEASETYKKTNESVMANNTAQADMNLKLAEAAEKLEPLITKGKEFLVNVLEKAQPLIDWVVANFDVIAPIILGIAAALTTFSTVMGIVNAVMLASPVTWIVLGIVAAISALIAIIVLVVKHWDSIKQVASNTWNTIKEVWGAVGEWFNNSVVQPVINFFTNLWEKLKEIWNGICNAVSIAFQLIVSIIDAYFQLITLPFRFIWENCKEYVFMAFEWIKEKIQIAVDWIKDKVQKGFELVKEYIINPVNEAKQKVTDFFQKMRDVINQKVTSLKELITRLFNTIKEKIMKPIEDAKNKATDAFEKLKSTISTKVNEAKQVVTNTFNSIKTAITGPIEKARDAVRNAVEKIKGFFKFNVSLPHIKLPHFSIQPSGWQLGDLLKGSIPSLGIDWYAKAMNSPMLLEDPTAFGFSPSGNIRVGGEAGDEIVGGANTIMGMIGNAVSNNNDGVEAKLDRLINLLTNYLPTMSNQQVVLSTGELVGALTSPLDKSLGELADNRRRGR